MNYFPDELLLQLFTYVPSRERRNSVRLVCRRWRRIAEDRIFLRTEQIFVNYLHDLDQVFSDLQLTHRSSINLSFVCRRFGQAELEHPFWKSCGKRVHSLAFEFCLFTFANFMSIVSSCPFVEDVSVLCDTTGLDILLENFPLQHTSANFISKLSFLIDSKTRHEVNYEMMNKILTSFPNLKELKLAIHHTHNYRKMIPEHQGDFELDDELLDHGPLLPIEEAPITAIIHYIESRNENLKRLWLIQSVPTSSFDLQERIVEVSGILSNLKCLEELTLVGPQFVNFDIQIPKDFLMQLTNVTIFHLSHIPHFDLNAVFNLILDNFSNLRVLQLETSSIMIFDEPIIRKLLSSKLKKLHLRCIYHLLHYEDSGKLPMNRTLNELVIFCPAELVESVNPLFAQIAPYLENLRYLALSHPDDQTLQSIFKFQTGLKSLLLDKSDLCSDYGFTGRNPDSRGKNSIRDLKGLEYLRVTDINLHRMAESTSLFFLLPKLKSMEMRILLNCGGRKTKHHFVTQLITVLKKNSLLESLQLQVPTANYLPMKKLEKFFSELKNLRYFSLIFNQPANRVLQKPTYEKIPKLFDVCPSLKFITHDKRSFFQQRISKHGLDILDITAYPAVFPKPKEILPKWSPFTNDEPD